MVENLIYLIDREGPEAKFVVWEHNTHLDRENWTKLGNKLHLKMGEEY